jgi:hypothetical protein
MKAGTFFRAFAALAIAGCNAILGIEEPLDRLPAGESCLLNSDCQNGQRCVFRVCSKACNADVDCPTGQRCLQQGSEAACVDSSTARCKKDADCGDKNVCADGECRNACGEGGVSCLEDQTCTNGVCIGKNEPDAGPTKDSGSDVHVPPGPSCTDQRQNGDETDVDCGGACTTKCAESRKCKTNTDCQSGLCDNAVCVPTGCSNGLKDGSETDVDCGGGCSNGCAEGKGCKVSGDCAQGVCSANQCAPAACGDAVKNGTETDVDCGGSCPAKCADLDGCAVAADCASGVCSARICQKPTCTDKVENGTEADVDCGSGCPQKCADGSTCGVDADCTVGNCSLLSLTCAAPTCSDGFKNGTEADVDCGGTSCALTPCAYGRKCAVNADCASGACSQGICRLPTCADRVKNGIETDVDCGGSCPPCTLGKACTEANDCVTGACPAGTCANPSCSDGAMNGTETSIDCGGPTCAQKCAQNQNCGSTIDCQQNLTCVNGRCVPPVCSNGSRDDDESAVDCGGGCAPCYDGISCFGNNDCINRVCDQEACAQKSCSDGVRNGSESDVDCGPSCAPCATGKACRSRGDCASGQCRAGSCQAQSCTDEAKNGSETGIDCGGGCPGCLPGERCAANTDCLSGLCKNGACQAATCTDSTQNADETDVDCGRVCSTLCKPTEGCKTRLDCTSNACVCGQCAPLGCGNGVKDGMETDVDCGGTPTAPAAPSDAGADGGDARVGDAGGTAPKVGCAACAQGKRCKVDADCADGPCNAGVCGGGYTDFTYSPANFDPTDFELQPTTVGYKTTFDCGVVTFDSTTLTFDRTCDPCKPTPKPVVRTQTGGSDVAILPVRNLAIAKGSTLRLVGNRPVILAAFGDVTIAGTLDASASGKTPGSGGNTSCAGRNGHDGGSQLIYFFYRLSGGGGAGFVTGGAQGGGYYGGAPGLPDSGPADLIPLVGGCVGGRATEFVVKPDSYGGAGGGAVQISAARSITISGSVLATGGIGINTGGGGSGGGIRLEANDVFASSASRIVADGASGGASPRSPGGAGGNGTTPPQPGAFVRDPCGLFCIAPDEYSSGGGGSVGRLAIRGVKSCLLHGTMSAATQTECPVGGGAPDGGVDAGTD